MTIEERIEKISKASGLSKEEINKQIKAKKEDAAGLLTDHGAVYALEKEFGLDSASGTPAVVENTSLSQLKPGLKSVNILGVVKEVGSLRKFKTDKREGQFSRIIISDSDKDVKAVLWDKMAEITASDKLSPGTILNIKNAYTKQGLDKETEIHIGGLSKIVIDPKNTNKKELENLPDIKEKLLKVKDTEGKTGSVTLHGKLVSIYPTAEFQRSDGTTGQRGSAIVADETGTIRLVLWGSSANLLNDFKQGNIVKLENALLKSNDRGPELHIGSRGRILPSDAKISLPEAKEEKSKISEISPNMNNLHTAGRIIRILPVKEFMSGDRKGKLASIVLADETGFSRAVLWNELADLSKEMDKGDIISLKNAYTKAGLSGETEIHMGRNGAVEINPEGLDMPQMNSLMEKHSVTKKIVDIEPDDKNVRVSGIVTEVDESPMVFEVCSECGARVENVAGEWLCDVCGETKPNYGMVLRCKLEDESGEIRSSFYRELAEQLSGMGVPEVMNEIGESGDELAPVKKASPNILGKEVEVIGNIRYNSYFDRLEMSASSISSIKEGKKLVKKKGKEEVISDDSSKEPPDVDMTEVEDNDMDIEEINLD